MTALVTGVAGFIGFHLAKRLISSGVNVVGFDNINTYYDVDLKLSRLKHLENISKVSSGKYSFVKGALEDYQTLNQVFKKYDINNVVNLAAQAGVRYSIENPMAYIQSNLVGFGNILEACRYNRIQHLVYASSSSVYGGNTKMPFSETDGVDHPISMYAATKKSNELMAHSYSHLYELPTTGLRFFTVYGPWGRPDMALFKFTKGIIEGKPIDVFNHGNHDRDFTYIDDIARGSKDWSEMLKVFYNKFHNTVEDVKQNAQRESGERVLGVDPNTGRTVKVRLGKFGPIAQIGEQDDENKPIFASLGPNQQLENITFKEVGVMLVIGLMVGVYLTYISPLVIDVTMSLAG